jgi:hypothetical protein
MLTIFKNVLQIDREENQLLQKSIKDVFSYNLSPSKKYSHKKILTIIACHSDTLIKYNTIVNNLKYFSFPTNHIVIVNSKDAAYSRALSETLEQHKYGYIEIPNNSHLDIGKWCHVLNLIDTSKYSHVVFTNDSFVITSSIYHFFNKMFERDVELYGYNDSTQECYHYQSYLFGVKESAVYKLQNLYSNKKHLLTNYNAVVNNIELKLVDTFKSTDCFLKIGNITSHRGKNIFFNNDTFYKKLFGARVLPLIKLKRLLLKS